jgi:hypothetical protein
MSRGKDAPVRVEISNIPHPTDQLVVCENCGESFAGFATTAEAADWIENHLREKHNRSVKVVPPEEDTS